MTDHSKSLRAYRIKITLIGAVFFMFFCVIILRAYQLQILDNAKLKRLARSQYRTKLILNPRRGAIYDRNGQILALDVAVASVGIHPARITDKKKTVQILVKHAGVSAKELTARLHSKKKFEWVRRRIPLDAGKAIEEARLDGVQVVQEYRRFYPNKELAGQVLGAVGYDAQALGGLELGLDDYLKSSLTLKNVERDARGRYFTPLSDAQKPHDVYLTIDKGIQNIAEEVLEHFAERHQVKNGFAIVLDVKTGEVLAMANYPAFNPNLYWKYPHAFWRNRTVSDVFEPGSTFKTIVMAAALKNGVIKKGERFFCENGRYRIHGTEIRDHHPYGWLTPGEILKVSSNIGITKIAEKLGRKRLYDFLVALKLDQKPGLGFPGEMPGRFEYYKDWQDIELSNIAFGQGLALTGLKMASAYAAIANGGWLLAPKIVKKIVKSNGQTVGMPPSQPSSRILGPDEAKTLEKWLHSVTEPGGTAPAAHLKGYLAGGKTGTAQKFDVKEKTYAKDQYVSSFIGYAPLTDPKILVYVVYDTPTKNGYFGGIVAAPAFRQIADRTLKYLGVPPPIATPRQPTDKNDYLKSNVVPAKDAQDVVYLSHEERLRQYTDQLAKIHEALERKSVPDLKGLSLRQVLTIMEGLPVRYEVSGSGVVATQWPAPGSPLGFSRTWRIQLAQR